VLYEWVQCLAKANLLLSSIVGYESGALFLSIHLSLSHRIFQNTVDSCLRFYYGPTALCSSGIFVQNISNVVDATLNYVVAGRLAHHVFKLHILISKLGYTYIYGIFGHRFFSVVIADKWYFLKMFFYALFSYDGGCVY
jgi:hypothetical protein